MTPFPYLSAALERAVEPLFQNLGPQNHRPRSKDAYRPLLRNSLGLLSARVPVDTRMIAGIRKSLQKENGDGIAL
jgi:hypothetical protein